MKKKYLLLLIVFVLLSIITYRYIYKDHRDISTETASFTTTVSELTTEFKQNTSETQKKYLNKTIAIEGIISEINDTNITLNSVLFCNMQPQFNATKFKINDTVSIKGRLIGYDDLLEEIKLDQCSIIK